MTMHHKIMEIPENRWPGIFIAGDEAAKIAQLLEFAAPLFEAGRQTHWRFAPPARKFLAAADVLKSCWIGHELSAMSPREDAFMELD